MATSGRAPSSRPVRLGSSPCMPTEQAAAVCLDVGSTWTKAVLVHPDGALAGFAEHPTTAGGRARRAWTRRCGRSRPPARWCGRRAGAAGLLVGGRRAAAGRGRRRAADQHRGRAPGGLLGGGARGARARRPAGARGRAAAAQRPARCGAADRRRRRRRPGRAAAQRRPAGPGPDPATRSLLAGNAAARDGRARRCCGPPAAPCWPAPTCTPRRGEVVPGPARAVLAELYERHVLGGRGPAVAPRFRRLVPGADPGRGGPRPRGAGPRSAGARVLVVDVGCATTDVHSAATGVRTRAHRRGRPRACARPRAGCWWRARPRASSTRWRPTCSGPTVAADGQPRSATCPRTRAARPRTGGSPRWPRWSRSAGTCGRTRKPGATSGWSC